MTPMGWLGRYLPLTMLGAICCSTVGICINAGKIYGFGQLTSYRFLTDWADQMLNAFSIDSDE